MNSEPIYKIGAGRRVVARKSAMKSSKIFFLAIGCLLLAQARGLAAPVLTCQPVNQTALAGSTVTFTVCATGAVPLSYQWRLRQWHLLHQHPVRHRVHALADQRPADQPPLRCRGHRRGGPQ